MTLSLRPHRQQGFSILELLIALSLSGLVLAALMGLFIASVRSQRRAEDRAALWRTGELAVSRIEHDLQFAGTGLPLAWGHGVWADERGLTLVGDLPRLHGQYPTLGLLQPRQDDRQDLLSWRNANNGYCSPPGCKTVSAGKLFGALEGCGKTGSGPDEGGSRVCAWGLGRAQGGEQVQIVNAEGEIAFARLSGERPQKPPRLECPGAGRACGVKLIGPPLAAGGEAAPKSLLDGSAPAWVTTLDQVFWWREGQLLLRQQCENPPPTSRQPRRPARSAPSGCRPIEVVARGVADFTAVSAGERGVIEISLRLRSGALQSPIETTVVGAARARGWNP